MAQESRNRTSSFSRPYLEDSEDIDMDGNVVSILEALGTPDQDARILLDRLDQLDELVKDPKVMERATDTLQLWLGLVGFRFFYTHYPTQLLSGLVSDLGSIQEPILVALEQDRVVLDAHWMATLLTALASVDTSLLIPLTRAILHSLKRFHDTPGELVNVLKSEEVTWSIQRLLALDTVVQFRTLDVLVQIALSHGQETWQWARSFGLLALLSEQLATEDPLTGLNIIQLCGQLLVDEEHIRDMDPILVIIFEQSTQHPILVSSAIELSIQLADTEGLTLAPELFERYGLCDRLQAWLQYPVVALETLLAVGHWLALAKIRAQALSSTSGREFIQALLDALHGSGDTPMAALKAFSVIFHARPSLTDETTQELRTFYTYITGVSPAGQSLLAVAFQKAKSSLSELQGVAYELIYTLAHYPWTLQEMSGYLPWLLHRNGCSALALKHRYGILEVLRKHMSKGHVLTTVSLEDLEGYLSQGVYYVPAGSTMAVDHRAQ